MAKHNCGNCGLRAKYDNNPKLFLDGKKLCLNFRR